MNIALESCDCFVKGSATPASVQSFTHFTVRCFSDFASVRLSRRDSVIVLLCTDYVCKSRVLATAPQGSGLNVNDTGVVTI